MPKLKERITASTGKKGTSDYAEASGVCDLYDETELAALVKAGLLPEHAPMLNEIVKIRAMDAIRPQSASAKLAGELRAAPADVQAQIKALLSKAKQKA